jgi:hypothetical protein
MRMAAMLKDKDLLRLANGAEDEVSLCEQVSRRHGLELSLAQATKLMDFALLLDHENLDIPRDRKVAKAAVVKAIQKGGSLVLRVQCEFVVHHSAAIGVSEDALAGLIQDQGVDQFNVVGFKVIEARNE